MVAESARSVMSTVNKTWHAVTNFPRTVASAAYDGVASATKKVTNLAYKGVANVVKRVENVVSNTWSGVKSIGKGLGNFFGWRKKKSKYS